MKFFVMIKCVSRVIWNIFGEMCRFDEKGRVAKRDVWGNISSWGEKVVGVK